MRYATGRGFDMDILNSCFQDVISSDVVFRDNSEFSIISEIRNFYVIVFGIQYDAFHATEFQDSEEFTKSLPRVYSFFPQLG